MAITLGAQWGTLQQYFNQLLTTQDPQALLQQMTEAQKASGFNISAFALGIVEKVLQPLVGIAFVVLYLDSKFELPSHVEPIVQRWCRRHGSLRVPRLCSSAKRKSHWHGFLPAIPRALARLRARAWYRRSRRMTNIPRKRSAAARLAKYVHLGRQKTRAANKSRPRRQHSRERTQQQQPEVEPLVARHERVQAVAHISGAIPHSHANQAQIVCKQQPTDGEKCCYEREPAPRVAKLCE